MKGEGRGSAGLPGLPAEPGSTQSQPPWGLWEGMGSGPQQSCCGLSRPISAGLRASCSHCLLPPLSSHPVSSIGCPWIAKICFLATPLSPFTAHRMCSGDITEVDQLNRNDSVFILLNAFPTSDPIHHSLPQTSMPLASRNLLPAPPSSLLLCPLSGSFSFNGHAPPGSPLTFPG